MAEVKWIKISVDMFDNRKIKHIRQLPNGDTMVLVWIMLLTIAGRCNDGGMIYLTPDMPYSTKMLADELRIKEGVVKSALEAFERLDMVERNGDLIIITGWSEHQNVTGLDRVREQTKKRVAKHREAKKNVTESNCNGECNVTERYTEYESNGNVTQGNATDIDIDIDIDNKKEKEKEKNDSPGEPPNDISYRKNIIEYLNQKAGTNYKHTSKSTIRHIDARINEGFDEADFRKVIDIKCKEWLGSNMEMYLRPETLFGSKFEGYLNQQIKSETQAELSPEREAYLRWAEERSARKESR